MKRRNFIKSTALASSALLSIPSFAEIDVATKKNPKSVIIIGAGFAGLSAAYTLAKKGISVQILESRNRIGGRVYSFKPEQANGQVIELGAEWVGNSHQKVKALCKEFDLELFNNQFDTHLIVKEEYSKAGKWGGSEKMEKFWKEKEEIWKTYSLSQKKKLDKMDWWKFLFNQGFTLDDLKLRDLLDSTDFGESTRHVSAYAAFAEYAESSEKNEMDCKIRGGNAMLAEKMADFIGRDRILLSHKVNSIHQQKKTGVTITCENGRKFQSDYLICATPVPSIQKINWSPALPNTQTEALNALQYARIAKFPLVFSERFWKEENFDLITDTPAHYFYHATKNQPGEHGILMGYATGDKADVLTSASRNQRESIILEALQPAFGNVRPYLRESLSYDWASDAYSFGAYALYGVGQWYQIMPELKKPFMYTHFAGEHLADWQGFMEGAIHSGEEAVNQILD